MSRCDKCKEMGLCFDKLNYNPEEFLEGNIGASIWIIGLNPKLANNKEEIEFFNKETKDDLHNRFKGKMYPYFKDFKKVKNFLYDGLINGTVAHTDLVKCPSQSWNFGKNTIKNTIKIVKNCKSFLENQIKNNSSNIKIRWS